MLYIIIMYYISYMKTQTQTSTMMFRSKVDIETSDIFFNYGAVKTNALDYSEYCLNELNYHNTLLEDAKNFLDIIHRPNLTPQDLVDDFLNRL